MQAGGGDIVMDVHGLNRGLNQTDRGLNQTESQAGGRDIVMDTAHPRADHHLIS
jgi:hypothetical protein